MTQAPVFNDHLITGERRWHYSTALGFPTWHSPRGRTSATIFRDEDEGVFVLHWRQPGQEGEAEVTNHTSLKDAMAAAKGRFAWAADIVRVAGERGLARGSFSRAAGFDSRARHCGEER